VPYTPDLAASVLAFNDRMHAGGTRWGWYGSPVDEWLPERTGHKTWREHWLAVEDGGAVRGAYALKPHEWSIRGQAQWVSDWQGPVSEGFVNARYTTLGLRLIRQMLKQFPLLYSWGHGGAEQPMLQMLEKLGWWLHPTPLCVRVVRPVRFLRRNAFLRSSTARRAALDALAFSGAGSVGLRLWHAARALPAARAPACTCEPFERFEAWADALWERCAPEYTALAVRDARTMNVLLKPGRWPAALKLRISQDGAPIGWAAVLDTQMEDDARYGSLRVGSVVDCLAKPGDAALVVRAAFRFLRERGVDLVVSNQAHPSWVDGFAANGFQIVRDRRLLAASPGLRAALEPVAETTRGLHLTNLDGHGPMAL
jgi:hypothetical protein